MSDRPTISRAAADVLREAIYDLELFPVVFRGEGPPTTVRDRNHIDRERARVRDAVLLDHLWDALDSLDQERTTHG